MSSHFLFPHSTIFLSRPQTFDNLPKFYILWLSAIVILIPIKIQLSNNNLMELTALAHSTLSNAKHLNFSFSWGKHMSWNDILILERVSALLFVCITISQNHMTLNIHMHVHCVSINGLLYLKFLSYRVKSSFCWCNVSYSNEWRWAGNELPVNRNHKPICVARTEQLSSYILFAYVLFLFVENNHCTGKS